MKNRLYRNKGIEIWYQNGEYLVLDKISRYGKFYKKLEEAKADSYLLRRINESN